MHTPKKRFENRRSERQCMSPTETIYVFRFGDSGLYAFTADPKGHVLPSRIYPQIDWRFQRSVTLRLDGSPPTKRMVRVILDAIIKHGFHLIHAAANTELLAFTAQHYDQRIDPTDD